MKILIVEDEHDLAEAVAAVCNKNNISIDIASDGEYGLDCALAGIYDVIILDIMLPKKDGLHILSELRGAGIDAPVLMLTARGNISDKVKGLNSGADDYLPKPFHMEELMARLNALGRRKSELLFNDCIQFEKLSFNPRTLTLSSIGAKEVNLTLKESQLLELLYAYREGILSKDVIIEKLWGYDADAQDSNVESQVSLLRKKLCAVGAEIGIKAIRGAGYRLEKAERE